MWLNKNKACKTSTQYCSALILSFRTEFQSKEVNDSKSLSSFIFQLQNPVFCLHLVSLLCIVAWCGQHLLISVWTSSSGKKLLWAARWMNWQAAAERNLAVGCACHVCICKGGLNCLLDGWFLAVSSFVSCWFPRKVSVFLLSTEGLIMSACSPHPW